ncbi:MAG: ABC transporter permease [Lachnospiraceae bacterium]|nr:ABC transporter permease [Lachnospiraceae bacterium]MCI9657261.1 ABC transporter permease [Lachnospiraceae bacterium]
MGIFTILWEKWREFVRDFSRITLAAMVAPLMYLIVFGWGIRTTMNGQPYLYFLIPGVISLTTMNGSFNAIAQNLNVQRLYEKAFDQVIISPTPLWQFIAGQIIAGALRGLYAGGIILLLVSPIKTGLIFSPLSVFILFLNGAVFSSLGIVVSFLARNHADVPRFSNYLIMPMAYLCNTFFSTDSIPRGARELIAALPLSQTSRMVRGIASGESISLMGIPLLLAYLTFFTSIALCFVYQKKNL